ncbi:hypothetical protein [Dyella ginsengisoli]|uniref:hypothetical protein n=1 Tax=Dyella ginsengisoli TaxID=363848 RepID=UPI000346F3D6|nr:hypothetical protein [Dyella ginsengisoli]
MSHSDAFPYAGVLASLDAGDFAGLAAELVDTLQKREALHALLKAAEAVHRAAVGTTQVADALRRDQKFVRPGPPSPHLVRLRQQQAAARQATNQARQAFIVAADAWIRVFGFAVPPKIRLESYAEGWLRELADMIEAKPPG